jgi:acyl-CoA dehydrogenase
MITMYKAPVEEIAFTLNHVAGLAEALEIGRLGDLSPDLVDAILEEAARFADNEIAPVADAGDLQGARIEGDVVKIPDGWPALYRHWREGGWNGLTAPEAFGGQALPHMLNVATLEMWASASMAFALAPTLTMGAIEAVAAHGSEALKNTYLAKMVSGEWTGTMNLTEPQAGSDLGALRTRAERREVSMMPPTTSSTSCLPACRMRPRARRAFRCSSCRNFWSPGMARSAPAMISSAIRSSTSSGFTARPPAR